MQGLLADGWFYLSAASLLVSGVLFFFLLGQYRAASAAADGAEGEAQAAPAAVPAAVRPVYIPDEPAPAKVASVTAEKPSSKPDLPPPSTPFDGPDRRRENVTGGLSPAVLYLQSIKSQLDTLNGSVAELAKRVDSITGRDEALIERLGELSAAVGELKNAAAKAPLGADAPKRAKKSDLPRPDPVIESPAAELSAALTPAKAEPKPEPKPEPKVEVAIETKPEPKPEPKAEVPPPAPEKTPAADETVRLELDAVISGQMAAKAKKKIPSPPLELSLPAAEAAPEKTPEPAPEPKAEPVPEPKTEAAAAPAMEAPAEDKPRRGPVWPV